mmetsp:Transcript_35807/g.71876  ORF Transcript_35807/g.71876 Transcript_35807/m.71876 type:complete len:256 (-) Transcript_35807:86-853(-)
MGIFQLLACSFVASWISLSHAGYVEDIPTCPHPCGDNPELLCPSRKMLAATAHEVIALSEGLTKHDFWDIRVDQADKHTVAPTEFKVMILDKENYESFSEGFGSYEACKESSQLNRVVSCLSLNGDFCRQNRVKVDGNYQYRNYTHVVISCENTRVNCPLEWNVGVVMMKKSKCVSLGMPCAATTALIWLFILAGLGAILFINRTKIMDALGPLELSSKWNVFSGRFGNSVEAMEAKLAQRSETGGGDPEPYTRL